MVAVEQTFMHSYILAADIGATKTNLGLFLAGSERFECLKVTNLKSCGEAELIGRVKEFMAREMGRGNLISACFGVAGPVFNGRVVATNLGLELEERVMRRELSCPCLHLVNDLVATAAGISLLEDGDLVSLQAGSNCAVKDSETVAIMAPGTGLGMAFMVADRPLMIISSEGGHADFAPRNETEVELWRYLQKRFGRVSRERLLSGPGLVNIFNWLREQASPRVIDGAFPEDLPAGEISGADVVAAAAAGDPAAERSMAYFTSILGSVAGDLALTGMTSGGLYLAGGIPAKIIDFLGRGHFLEAFRAKGRMSDWLKQVPVKVILNPEAALIGAARIARERITPFS